MTGSRFEMPGGEEIYLTYNGIAILKLGDGGAGRQILEDTPEGIRALASCAAALAEGGELARRHLGYDSARIPTGKELSGMPPVYIALLRLAVLQAIIDGSGGDAAETEEEDVGLAELRAKNKTSEKDRLDDLLTVGAIAGLSAKETLLVPVGTLNKIAEEGAKRGGMKCLM